jgi:hypothetical protein
MGPRSLLEENSNWRAETFVHPEQRLPELSRKRLLN